jgi:hypothetical protein
MKVEGKAYAAKAARWQGNSHSLTVYFSAL